MGAAPEQACGAASTVQSKSARSVTSAWSVAVTDTRIAVPAVLGVPEITPEARSMTSPAGSRSADQRYGGTPPVAVSGSRTAAPAGSRRFPGLVTSSGAAERP